MGKSLREGDIPLVTGGLDMSLLLGSQLDADNILIWKLRGFKSGAGEELPLTAEPSSGEERIPVYLTQKYYIDLFSTERVD